MARLKVFVFDHVATGGTQIRHCPESLQHQSDMLLRALLADLSALPDVQVVTMAPGLDAAPGYGFRVDSGMDSGVGEVAADYAVADGVSYATTPVQTSTQPGTSFNAQPNAQPNIQQSVSTDAWRFGGHFVAGMQAADAVWPLARGSESMLERLSRSVVHGKRILLGSAPRAVEVAASKLELARVLADRGVAAVATYSPHALLPQDHGPWVVKPDDGAGCLDTRLFNDHAAALAWIRASAMDGYVLQPFIGGKLGSLSLICCDGAARVLACNQERVAMHDNRFHYLGSVVNGLVDDDGALARLAQQVAAAIPGLWGYVGVDFVVGVHGAVVLDVNPRLTAAYAGLHASIGCNPAGLVLDLLKGPAGMLAPAQMRRPVSVDAGMA